MSYHSSPVVILLALLLLTLACARPATSGAPSAASHPPSSGQPAVATSGETSTAPKRTALYTPTQRPPRVDMTIAGVPLENVLFDTFRGGYVPLPQADMHMIESLRDAIAPIYEPVYEPVEGGDWLGDDDLVIGYASKEGAFAYPIKILNLHEIVNDFIGGVPVLVSYCPLCASAVVYNRELDGQVLVFGNTSALYIMDMVMYDHQTGSYWYQVAGEAIVGTMTGKRLKLLPSVTTSWAEWKEQHPDTWVLSRDLGLIRGADVGIYDRDPYVDYGQYYNQEPPEIPNVDEETYGKLRPGDKILALEVNGKHKAYSFSPGDQVINDQVGGERVVVMSRAAGPVGYFGTGEPVVMERAASPNAVAYFRSVDDGRPMSFRITDGSLEDVGTGSRWNDSGLAVSGPLAGTQLEAVPSRTSFWFAVVASLPGIELYRPG